MGVPGFFAWLLKKYKSKQIIFKKDELTDLDNIEYLLIDANCLVHNVLNNMIGVVKYDTDHNFEIKFINEIIKYLSLVINTVDVKKKIYFAIDGVAPMTKIKQQRLRRYSSINDSNVRNEIKKKYNKDIVKTWDRTSITPGTPFMYKLHIQLLKLESNNFIYSSYLEPGEGEHKLLQFIKDKSKDNKKRTYAFYGLDADLIFLSLLVENQNIFLLRENIEFDKNKNNNDLVFVSIEILKDLIYKTMMDTYKLSFGENVILDHKNITNDFIFICYLLGNDFLPHLPSINIRNSGLEIIINNYFKAFNDINYVNINKRSECIYIINDTELNKDFLTLLFKYLSYEEDGILKKLFNNKRTLVYKGSDDPYDKELFKVDNLQFHIEDDIQLGKDKFEDYRKRYYKHYWNVEDDEIEEFSYNLTYHYLSGLRWVALYYFESCPSWDWYYPYDNAPFVTDIYKHISKINFNTIEFSLGKPVEPIIQLLTVLPRQSSYLLPNIFMIKIPTTHYGCMYPVEFELDFINKNKYYQANPILPPLDLDIIKNFYNEYKEFIKDKEKKYIYNK